jgi:hypothetical protein
LPPCLVARRAEQKQREEQELKLTKAETKNFALNQIHGSIVSRQALCFGLRGFWLRWGCAGVAFTIILSKAGAGGDSLL